jgi:hypothetical protein
MAPPVEPPFRRDKLYSLWLTPRFEITKDAWEIVGPILFEGREYVPPEEAYPWFFSLDDNDRQGVVNYSEELDCLHEDLDFALIDMETAQEDSYSDRFMKVDASMYFRRLALSYHTENVDLRVYAYREKVFKLVQHLFGLKGIKDGNRLKDHVRNALIRHDLVSIAPRLDTLGDSARVPAVLERRRLFTHGLKERDQFRFLTPTSRFDDSQEGLDTTAKAQRYMDLEAAYRQRWSEIDELCASLAQFRFDLVQRLTTPETWQRWHAANRPEVR